MVFKGKNKKLIIHVLLKKLKSKQNLIFRKQILPMKGNPLI